MPLRVRLNGDVISNDVHRIEDIEEEYFYQMEIFTYLHEITGSLIFTGSAYNTIRSLFDGNICEAIQISIEDDSCGQYQAIYEGEIYLSDVNWNLTECSARVSISDSGIIGLIDDNKSVPVNLYVNTLKNGGNWNPISVITDIGFVDPTSSFATANGRQGIRVFDALKRVAEVISDGQISVRSDYFDPTIGNTNEAQKWCVLMKGRELRAAEGITELNITYEDLMRDLNKLYNIAVGFEIDQSTGERFLRIEPKSFFFKENENGYYFEGVPNVEQSVEEDLFYAVMSFGSYEPASQFDYIERVLFLSHEEQKFHLGGQCNIDNTLDLITGTLVYDTNVIQRVLPVAVGGLADESWDEEVFIIHIFEPTPPNPHIYYGTFTLLPYNPARGYFNDHFSPHQVALRWFGSVPFSIYSYLGGTGSNDSESINLNPQFTQIFGAPPTIGAQYQWLDFPTDLSDPSNNFSHSPIVNPAGFGGNISHYTAPAGGLYKVELNFDFTGWWQYVQFLVFDAAGALQYYINPYNAFEGGSPTDPYGGGIIGLQLQQATNLHIQTSAIIPVETGSRITALLPYSLGTITQAEISVKSTFSGEFQSFDFSSTKYLRTKFEFPLPLADRNEIFAAQYAKQRLSYNGGDVNGFLNKMKRNLESGSTLIEWLGSF